MEKTVLLRTLSFTYMPSPNTITPPLSEHISIADGTRGGHPASRLLFPSPQQVCGTSIEARSPLTLALLSPRPWCLPLPSPFALSSPSPLSLLLSLLSFFSDSPSSPSLQSLEEKINTHPTQTTSGSSPVKGHRLALPHSHLSFRYCSPFCSLLSFFSQRFPLHLRQLEEKREREGEREREGTR